MSEINPGDRVQAVSTRRGQRIITAIGVLESYSDSGTWATVKTNTGARIVAAGNLEKVS